MPHLRGTSRPRPSACTCARGHAPSRRGSCHAPAAPEVEGGRAAALRGGPVEPRCQQDGAGGPPLLSYAALSVADPSLAEARFLQLASPRQRCWAPPDRPLPPVPASSRPAQLALPGGAPRGERTAGAGVEDRSVATVSILELRHPWEVVVAAFSVCRWAQDRHSRTRLTFQLRRYRLVKGVRPLP